MIRIEKVTTNDTKELLKIYRPYVEDTAITFEYEVPSEEEFAERIRTISAKYPYIKAVDEKGSILGYAYATSFKGRAAYDWAVETTVYLREDCRGKGVGKVIYGALEDILQKMGILNLNACIAVPKTEDPHLTDGSVHFHKKMGYKSVGIFHDCGYKFNTWYHMTWMEKMVGEHVSDQSPVEFGQWEKYL